MDKKKAGLLAVMGCSAVIAAGAAGFGIAQGSPSSDTITAGDMTTGETITATTAPTAAPIPMAKPDIKGPAPLPVEEQGLPG
jgi:hypothetical protein